MPPPGDQDGAACGLHSRTKRFIRAAAQFVARRHVTMNMGLGDHCADPLPARAHPPQDADRNEKPPLGQREHGRGA